MNNRDVLFFIGTLTLAFLLGLLFRELMVFFTACPLFMYARISKETLRKGIKGCLTHLNENYDTRTDNETIAIEQAILTLKSKILLGGD